MRAILLFVLALAVQDSSLEELIRRLGNPDVKERDSASAELLKRGKEIRARLVLASKEADPEIASRAREVVSRIDASLDSARIFVAKLMVEEKDSYQRCLWRAYHWFNPVCSDKDWFEIGPALRRQGFQDVQMSEQQHDRVEYRFRLAADLFATSTGLKHDLCLNVQVQWTPSTTERSQARVSRVVPVLSASAKERYKDVASRKPYPKGTALAEALDHAETKKTAAEFPYLEQIEVEYLPLWDRYVGVESFRFWGHLELSQNPDLPRKWATMSFDARSLLDPERNLATGESSTNHAPKDELKSFELHGGGSGEWGYTRGLVSLDNPRPRIPITWMGRGPVTARAFSEVDVEALPEDTEALVLKCKGSSDPLAEKLGRLKRLRKLEAGSLGNRGLIAISALPALEELEAKADGATGQGLEALARASTLRKLELYNATGLSDAGLKRLSELKELRSLAVYGASSLTDAGLEVLPSLAGLENLFLSGMSISRVGFDALSKCTNLHWLYLGSMKVADAESIEALAKSCSLREVDLTYVVLDDDAFGRLAKIRTLEYLKVYYYNPPGTISDAGLIPFRSHPSLRALHLNETSVTPEATRALAESLKGRFLPY